jgi:hypothetical protein
MFKFHIPLQVKKGAHWRRISSVFPCQNSFAKFGSIYVDLYRVIDPYDTFSRSAQTFKSCERIQIPMACESKEVL